MTIERALIQEIYFQNLTWDCLILFRVIADLMRIMVQRFSNKWGGHNQLPTGTFMPGLQIGNVTGLEEGGH